MSKVYFLRLVPRQKIVPSVDACRHAAELFKLRVKIGRPTSWLIGFWDHIALSGNGNWDHFFIPPMSCRLGVVWGKDVSKQCMQGSTLVLSVKFQAFSRLFLAFSRTRQHHKVCHCWPLTLPLPGITASLTFPLYPLCTQPGFVFNPAMRDAAFSLNLSLWFCCPCGSLLQRLPHSRGQSRHGTSNSERGHIFQGQAIAKTWTGCEMQQHWNCRCEEVN